MRAARIHAFGGSEKVKIEAIAVPTPGRSQALVRIRAAGVNPVDWAVREKIYNPKGADRLPLTLGQDFAGTIEDIGPAARGPWRKGDAVLGELWGSFAEYALVPLKDLVRKPRSLSFRVAAAIPMPALTAWQMVIDTARANSQKTFLIHGAGGPVGSFAAQLANSRTGRSRAWTW